MLTPQDQALSPSIEIHSCMRREEYVLRKRRRISTINTRDASPIVTRSRSNNLAARDAAIFYTRNIKFYSAAIFRTGFAAPEKRAEWLNACRERNIPSVLPIMPQNRIPFCLFILRRYASHCAPKAPLRDSDREEKRIFRRSVTVVSVVSACIANSHRIEKEWNFPPASRANTNAFVIRVRAQYNVSLYSESPANTDGEDPTYIWKARLLLESRIQEYHK